MATIRIAAVGNKENGINEINPRFQANALRNIRGIDCGVLANSFYNEDSDYYGINKVQTQTTLKPFRMITCSTSQIEIGEGMATAYGYDFQMEESEAVSTLDDGTGLAAYCNVSGTRYIFVYLEWDLSGDPQIGSVKLHGNGTASIWRSLVTSNANLIDNPNGIYRLPIWRITVTSNAIAEYTSWEDMNLCPTITRPQVAEVARFAEDPTGVGDEIANTRYVESKTDENLSAMQDALNTLYEHFNEGTFTILGIPCIITKQNGLCLITSDYYTESPYWNSGEKRWGTQWTKRLSDFAVGDVIGNLPTAGAVYPTAVDFYPRERLQVYITFAYTYTSNNVAWDGTTRILTEIAADGSIIVAELPSSSGSETSIYPWFTFSQTSIHIGFKSEEYDTPSVFDKHKLTLAYDKSKVMATAPEYYTIGKAFELRATATGYSEEIVIEVEGANAPTGGNGTYTITPTEVATVIKLSTRYVNGGTDEDGGNGATSAPTVTATRWKHNINIANTTNNVYTAVDFSFENTVSTAYTTAASLRGIYGSALIPVTGYSMAIITVERTNIYYIAILSSGDIEFYTSVADVYSTLSCTITDTVEVAEWEVA